MARTRVNLRTVAKAAGVSLATVSLALRGHPSILETTRSHVRKVAEELGYRPNARVAELMGEIRRGRQVDSLTESVAILWSDATRDEVRGYEHLVEFEAAMRERLEQQGFGLDTFYRDEESIGTVERILLARGIRGIILAPLINLTHRHLNWDWSNFSVIIAGSGLWRPEFHRVRFNHFEEMALILHHLRHLGAGSVAFVTEKAVDMRSQRAGVGGFLAHVGKSTKAAVFESNGKDRTELLRWLRQTKPEFLILSSSVAAHWILESKVKCRLVLTNQHLHPAWQQFAGIQQDYRRLGVVSAEQLIAQLTLHQSGPPERPMKVFITGTWRNAAS